MVSTAENVASGELADVSLEFCSATPLERRGFEHIAELARAMKTKDDVAEKGDEEKTRSKPRKAAPVDQGDTISLVMEFQWH